MHCLSASQARGLGTRLACFAYLVGIWHERWTYGPLSSQCALGARGASALYILWQTKNTATAQYHGTGTGQNWYGAL